MPSVKPAYMLFFLLSILIATSITLSTSDRKESPTKQYDLELPQMRIDAANSDIGQWIVPAIMKGEKLKQSFIENNVYISEFKLSAPNELKSLMFTIYYLSGKRPVIRSYQLDHFGEVVISKNLADLVDKDNAPLVRVSSFIQSFNTLDRDELSAAYGVRISSAQLIGTLRLEETDIDTDTTVIVDGKMVLYGDLQKNGPYAACYITLMGVGAAAQIPFLIPI